MRVLFLCALLPLGACATPLTQAMIASDAQIGANIACGINSGVAVGVAIDQTIDTSATAAKTNAKIVNAASAFCNGLSTAAKAVATN